MKALWKGSLILFSLAPAIACLAGILAITNISGARANPGEAMRVRNVMQPPLDAGLKIDPLSFSATLPISGRQTDTLTISNTGDAVLTVTVYEVTASQLIRYQPTKLEIPNPAWLPANPPARVQADVHTQILFMGQARVIIYLRGGPDFSTAHAVQDRETRLQVVYQSLLESAALSDDLYDWLVEQGAEPRRLLTANALAATLDETQLAAVLSFPQVERVGINGYAQILRDQPAAWNWLQPLRYVPGTVEWNIAKIRADETWSILGVDGSGAVVGVVDTGVMYLHPALNTQYRGNLGGGNFDHNYNWYDLVNGQAVPYDDHSHGTMGAGIAVGGDGGANKIGVAPGARWIAIKALDAGGGTTFEDLHAALQWMLAPTDLDGLNPDPKLAPQVVLNMWGISGFTCDHSFDSDLAALRAANILPVFAPGGEGPGCGTVAIPATNPGAFSAGATDSNDLLSGFSARGPSCYDGSIKPDVAAPGVNIRSSSNDGDYQKWSGTSLSAAHLAGASALLFSANPRISLDELEQTLMSTAVCRDNLLYCGGEPCPAANNAYGFGRIDVFEAVSLTLSTHPPFDLPWLNVGPLVIVLPPGQLINLPVIFDATLLQPGVYRGGIGVESTDPTAPFTFLPVSLTVTSGCQPLMDVTAHFTPGEPMVGQVVTFTATASGTLPISYTWSFDDGPPGYGIMVTHLFSNPGTHEVELSVENPCDQDRITTFVFVEAILQRFLIPLVRK